MIIDVNCYRSDVALAAAKGCVADSFFVISRIILPAAIYEGISDDLVLKKTS